MNGDLFSTAPARPARRRKPPRQTKVIISAEAISAVVARQVTAELMIAEAVRAARPEATKVSVDLGSIRWTDPAGERVTFGTPASVRKALLELSEGCTTAPFRFVLGRTKRAPLKTGSG